MKKNLKFMCVALVLSTTTMAQEAKTEPAAQTQKRGTKIVFPPNVMAKVKTLGDVELVSDLMNTTVTVIGNSDDGLILKTEKGEKILMNKPRKRPPVFIPYPPPGSILKWTPIAPKSTTPTVYKLVGVDDKNTPVWAGADGKGSCKIDEATGKKNDYVGHVTLLR
jgi:hypothetical protein